ncbi:hypothetical protein AMATHDRAFT_152156 [Amanita thiersii Skay4041]|uniref:Uncharacterized protein n=1 Tax=Amanita thiersii Skay4041 TaxID=703135 RepID=A0A2A9NI08_9AGAR|nr:hypothetical protein AMATHDRAFT_152156 [Amanita thiersii Skay4041]
MSKHSSPHSKRALPSKEASLFKELLTLYETRQLKKGLKASEQILKKFPEHETLCMKGLVLTHMGKREEGLELVKKGIRLDLTSHICWHVFGLIQKGEKNYEEALKSYAQALRFDKDNLNILRDAAQLQTQLRLFDALVETRHTILRLRPNLRQNWIGLAVAYHLNGNLQEAKDTLEHYQKILKASNVPVGDIEHSETLLYHIRVLEELGEFSDALSLLDTNVKQKFIIDRTAILEARARLLQKLKSDDAEKAWRALIQHNPDCYSYYQGYLSSQNLDLASIFHSFVVGHPSPETLQVLLDFSTQLPKARAPQRLSLTVASGDEFKKLVKSYLFSSLEKGIPSLFADVKALYKDDFKCQTIESIVEDSIKDWNSAPSDSDEPTTYLWTLYFLAQHHSYLGRHERALSVLDTALIHTPTLPELHIFKARVLKRCGDYLGAARCSNDARLLDGQDRFLNTKCGKYLLRAGMVEEANSTLGLFTKKDAASPAADLEDMQSLLYLMEEANAEYRAGRLHLALKKFRAVHKVFSEFGDDQYDFHGYNLRKFIINIYRSLLEWEDTVQSHPAHVASVVATAQIFVAVHDDPSLASAASRSALMTDEEKKAKKKAKKAAQKTQEEAKKAPSQSQNEDKGLEPPALKDDDPDGSKYLRSPDPLELAAKLLNSLQTPASGNIELWFAVYDVSIRRRKFLQAIKALHSARSLNSDHPELHYRIVHLHQTISSLPQSAPNPIGPIISENVQLLFPEGVSPETYNSQYLQQHSASAPAILAAAKVSAQILKAPRDEVEGIIFSAIADGVQLDIKTGLSILLFLTSISSPRMDEFRIACDTKFPLSTAFKTPEEQTQLRQQVLAAGDLGPAQESEDTTVDGSTKS